MVEETEEKQLWALLADEAEIEDDSLPPPVADLSQSPTFLDRLAQRLASGVLPLFLAGLGSMLPFAMMDGLRGISLGLVLLFALCWALAPLVRSRGFTSVTRLALLFVPLTVLAVTVAVVPSLALNKSDPLFAGFLYQFALEAMFDWPGLALFAVVLFCLGLPVFLTGKSRPWTRIQPAGRGRRLLATAAVLGPFALYGALWFFAQPSVQAQQFRARIESTLEPQGADGKLAWYDLYTQYNLIKLDPEDQQNAPLARLAEQMVEQAGESLPDSQSEADAACYAASELLKRRTLELHPTTRTELAYLLVHSRLISRPRYQYLDTIDYLHTQIFPDLWQRPDVWEKRLLSLRAQLEESQIQELDQSAWSYFSQTTELEPEVFGKLQGTPTRRKVYLNPLKQLQEQKPQRARPLKLLGWELDCSPSQLAENWVQKRDLSRWFELREELETLDPEQQLSRLQSLLEGNSLSSSFLESLEGRCYRFHLEPWLDSAELILELRKQADSGQAPHLSAEQKKRWSLQNSDGELRLADSKTRRIGGPAEWVLR